MINITEIEIVKLYVIKNRQDRIVWELGNPKKRDFIMIKRFPGPENFKKSCMRSVEYMAPDEMKTYLHQLSKAKEVYYIGDNYIGVLSLEQATLRANTGELCIIYCGNGIGYYQGEQEFGKPPRYLLINQLDCQS